MADGKTSSVDGAWLELQAVRLLEFAAGSRTEDGFGWLDDDGRVDATRPAPLWLVARMTYVFALGSLLPGHSWCGELADHGLVSLSRMADEEHGGWCSETRPSAAKDAFGHAFVLLAGATAVLARRPRARALFDRAAWTVLVRFWVEREGACCEMWDRTFTRAEPYRGANGNMHMVEAFLAAFAATGDSRWTVRALRIAECLIGDHAAAHAWRIPEHYDAAWRPLLRYNADRVADPLRPFGATPGHGFEWARLLLQLHAALPEPPSWLGDAARALFARAAADGSHPEGGFVYTTDFDGRPVVRKRLHWPVAEAIGAAAGLHAITGGHEYAEWHDRLWTLARRHFIDRDRGGWRHKLVDGDAGPALWLGKPDAYHAFQAILLAGRRPAPCLAIALRERAMEPFGSAALAITEQAASSSASVSGGVR